MIYCIQIILVFFILHSAWTGSDTLQPVQPTFNQMTLRLLCCYLFHLGNYRDVAESYKRLKFLRRYPEKFSPNYIQPAFMVTFFQFTASVFVEFANIIFLTRQENLVELMMNYVAFLGVSQLDNLYVEATHKMKAAKIILNATGDDEKKIQDAIRFKKKCSHDVESNTLGRCEYPLPVFMRFVIVWFELSRFVYKAIYFYLFPYAIVPVSYLLYDVTKDPKHRVGFGPIG